MTKPKAPKRKRTEAGHGKVSTEARHSTFVEAYLSNGGNVTKAALAAGFSPKTAASQGSRLLKNVKIRQIIDNRQTVVLSEMRIDADRVLEETARLAFSDVSKIIGPDGKILLPHQLDEATRAAVKGFEIDEYGRIKYQFWDKNAASERLFKHLNLYKDDNKGKAPITQVAIVQLAPLQPLPKGRAPIDGNSQD